MKVDMSLGLKDVPGSLITALTPISDAGGNIVSVVHMRGKRERVGVKVVYKIRDVESLERIKKALTKKKVHITEIRVEGKRYYTKKTLSFLFVGHVIDTDIRDTIDRINEVGLASDVDVVMPDPDMPSSVMINVDVDEKKYPKLMQTLKNLSNKKELLLISSIE